MTIDDKATEFEELRREIALKYRKPTPKPMGYCYWCESETTGTFCSSECREDWEQSKRFKNKT